MAKKPAGKGSKSTAGSELRDLGRQVAKGVGNSILPPLGGGSFTKALGDSMMWQLTGLPPSGSQGPSANSQRIKQAYKKATGEKPPKDMSLAEMKRQTKAAQPEVKAKTALAGRRRAANNAMAADMGRGGGQKMLGLGPAASVAHDIGPPPKKVSILRDFNSYADGQKAQRDYKAKRAALMDKVVMGAVSKDASARRAERPQSKGDKAFAALARNDTKALTEMGAFAKPPLRERVGGAMKRTGDNMLADVSANYAKKHGPPPEGASRAQRAAHAFEKALVAPMRPATFAAKVLVNEGFARPAAYAMKGAGHVVSTLPRASDAAAGIRGNIRPALGGVATALAAADTYKKARASGDSVGGAAAWAGGQVAVTSFASAVLGKAFLPLVGAYGAVEGGKEDKTNRIRGAVRGASRALDPTGIWNPHSGFFGKGYGEMAVNKVWGEANSVPPKAPEPRNSSFLAANERYHAMRQAAHEADPTKRRQGFSNAARIGAYNAKMAKRGKPAENAPYGGDPNGAGPMGPR